MTFCYDDDLVEAAVFIAASGKRAGVQTLQVRRFNIERERCYSLLDPDDRQAAFARLQVGWFREWGLEELLLGAIKEYPLLSSSLNTLAFRKARAKKEEAAELYVSAENGRSAVVAMRPERFERDDAVLHFLRHELMHLSDMLDPAFGYAPDLRTRGVGPSHERIIRERYRLLWDITIDGRLDRAPETARHRAVFDEAFEFWPVEQREEVFTKLRTAKSPRHEELFTLAADPRDLSHVDKPLPGGNCPLCGFSTFEWAGAAALDESIRSAIMREFPHWFPAQGACLRCAEVYTTANRYADALPQ
jgi:hypothetical protein